MSDASDASSAAASTRGRGSSAGAGAGAAVRRHGPAIVLALGLGGAGSLHLIRPDIFDPLIPPFLGAPRPWTIGSGLVELLVAALLVLPRTRRVGGWAAAALLVAVFPGNVYLAVQGEHPALGIPGERWLHLARLPFQIPLVAWAVWVARRERSLSP